MSDLGDQRARQVFREAHEPDYLSEQSIFSAMPTVRTYRKTDLVLIFGIFLLGFFTARLLSSKKQNQDLEINKVFKGIND